jgi:hypothetical protein
LKRLGALHPVAHPLARGRRARMPVVTPQIPRRGPMDHHRPCAPRRLSRSWPHWLDEALSADRVHRHRLALNKRDRTSARERNRQGHSSGFRLAYGHFSRFATARQGGHGGRTDRRRIRPAPGMPTGRWPSNDCALRPVARGSRCRPRTESRSRSRRSRRRFGRRIHRR